MDGNEKVKKYVRAMMKRENINPEALAKLAGVCPGTVRNFLDGRRNASLRAADKYLGVFGLEIKIGRKST